MIDVIVEVLKRSRSKGTDRCVAVVLADAASKDGVGWLGQEEIAQKANCDEREVRRATRELERLVELEVRKAQRGRRRINVYRVVVGKIGWRDVDYDRLPFDLDRPFSRPDELSARHVELLRREGHHSASETPPAATGRIVRPSGGGDDRTDPAVTTGHLVPDDRTSTRARVADPPLDPRTGPAPDGVSLLKNQEGNPVPETSSGERDPVERKIVESALAEALGRWPETRKEWGSFAAAVAQLVEVGATVEEIEVRAARYRRRWPTVALTAQALVAHWSLFSLASTVVDSGVTIRPWVEKTSWQLGEEEAHWMVDEWAGLDPVERAAMHELVDEVRASRAERAGAASPANEEAAA